MNLESLWQPASAHSLIRCSAQRGKCHQVLIQEEVDLNVPEATPEQVEELARSCKKYCEEFPILFPNGGNVSALEDLG